MRPFKVNDARWTWGGDLVIGDNGDLEDTNKTHELVSFIQEIRTRLRSDLYDWKLHPHIGASLSDLQGEPNNRETAESGKAKIIASLTKDGLVAASLIKIRYMPISRHHVHYNVQVSLPDVTEEQLVNLSLLLNTEDSTVIFL